MNKIVTFASSKTIIYKSTLMNKEDESDLLKWLQDKDVSEVISEYLIFFVILNEVSFFFAIFAERDRDFIFIYSG